MREVLQLVLGTMVEDGVVWGWDGVGFALQRPRLIAVYEVRVLRRGRCVVQKILCKKRTLFIFYFPSLFNNSTMMAAQIRWCSRGCILDQIT